MKQVACMTSPLRVLPLRNRNVPGDEGTHSDLNR
jgi:hypothetical protein